MPGSWCGWADSPLPIYGWGAIAWRGKPDLIMSDHGTDFTSNAMLARTKAAGVTWHFIAPGKPIRDRICDAFNSKIRGEILNETLHRSARRRSGR